VKLTCKASFKNNWSWHQYKLLTTNLKIKYHFYFFCTHSRVAFASDCCYMVDVATCGHTALLWLSAGPSQLHNNVQLVGPICSAKLSSSLARITFPVLPYTAVCHQSAQCSTLENCNSHGIASEEYSLHSVLWTSWNLPTWWTHLCASRNTRAEQMGAGPMLTHADWHDVPAAARIDVSACFDIQWRKKNMEENNLAMARR